MDLNIPIDFVVTWVDMNDERWKKNFHQFSKTDSTIKNGVSDARFRDYGFLKYWFRGVDKYASWVNKIYFVTDNQRPEWLNIENPKIEIVNHSDFIPKQYLPTFNSVVIERYIHKIPGLSEHFVYFNDDFYIIKPTEKKRFFQNGLPCDIAVFQYNPSWSQYYVTLKNNIKIINQKFDKKEVLAKFPDKWFTEEYGTKIRANKLWRYYPKFITLRTHHNAQPFLKSTFEEVWDFAGKELSLTSINRFRAIDDLTPELFRTWQICRGNFTPYNTYKDTKMFPLLIKWRQAIKAIYNQEFNLICLNDNIHIKNYDQVMNEIAAAFQHIFPEKSSFEL